MTQILLIRDDEGRGSTLDHLNKIMAWKVPIPTDFFDDYDTPTRSLLLDYMLKARREPGEVMFSGQIVQLKTGQFVRGRKKDSERLQLSESVVRRCYKQLEELKVIKTIIRTSKYTIAEIVNYSEITDISRTQNTRYPASSESNKETSEHPLTNKENRENKISISSRNKNLSFEEGIKQIDENMIQELQREYKLNIRDELKIWRDYYLGKGQTFGDYPAAFRTWLRRTQEEGKRIKDPRIYGAPGG